MPLFFFIFILHVRGPLLAQEVVVHSEGELFFSGTTDASSSPGVRWVSYRGAKPGFFSVREDGRFMNYSDRYHIDGYMKKLGNTAFIFPVGNGVDLRAFEISKADLPTDAYAVAWLDGDPGTNPDPTFPNAGLHPVDRVQAPIEAVSRVGQWDWMVGEGGNLGNQTTGSGKGIRVLASIPDLSQFADKNDLRLVGWNGNSWIDLSGKPSANGSARNSRVNGTMLPGISAVAIGRVRKNLPGQIASLEATVVDCRTRLQWKTSYERGVSAMVVEQSINEDAFRPIRTISSQGTPDGRLYTAWVDQPGGTAFYRIRMEGGDGTASVSPTAYNSMPCKDRTVLDIFPNPVTAQQQIQVRLNADYSGPAIIHVYTTTGRLVKSANVACKVGTNLFSMRVADLAGGYYIVECRKPGGGTIAASSQFIKQ